MTRTPEELLESIDSIYRAATEPELWSHALQSVAASLGCRCAHLLLWDERASAPVLSITNPGTEDENQDYAAHFHTVDPHHGDRLMLPLGRFSTNQAFLARGLDSRSEFYQDFYGRHGFRYMLTGRLHIEGSLQILAGFHRVEQQRAWAPVDIRRAEALVRHLQGAVRLQRRLAAAEGQATALAGALDRVPWAVLVVDSTRRVRHANAAALHLVAEGDPLVSRGERLFAATTDETDELSRAILGALGAAAPPTSEVLVLTRRSDGRRFAALVVPLPATHARMTGVALPAALLLVSDPGTTNVAPDRLFQRLWGLTPAETHVVEAIGAGATLDEIAAERGVSKNTVRTLLAHASSKCGVSRQAELARLVNTLPSTATPPEL